MRTFAMGDIHGAHQAVRQCLERSGFDRIEDSLIQLGDIVDGHDEVFECVEELLKIPNLIAIRGNHDNWLNDYILTGYHPMQWMQGGYATARSYLRSIGKEDKIFRVGSGYKTALNPADIPESHRQFFNRQHLYHIDEDNNCYVHGGFNRHIEFKVHFFSLIGLIRPKKTLYCSTNARDTRFTKGDYWRLLLLILMILSLFNSKIGLGHVESHA